MYETDKQRHSFLGDILDFGFTHDNFQGMKTVHDKRFGAKVLLHRHSFIASDPTLCHYWNGFPFSVFMRWQWFFRYRAALVQIEHPRKYVELVTWNYDYVPEAEELKQRLKNKIKSKKGKITQYKNSLKKAEKEWNQLFPIEEYILYQKAVAKIDRLERELNNLQRQFSAL